MNKSIKIAIICLVIAVFLGGYFYTKNTQDVEVDNQVNTTSTQGVFHVDVPLNIIPPDPNTTSTWKKYTNDKYRFEIEYPSNWYIQESEDPGYPSITFYKEATSTALGHRSNQTLVTIYPFGYGAESMEVGKVTSDILLSEKVKHQYDMTLFNTNERFATLAFLDEGWNDSGFIMSRLKVLDLHFGCKLVINTNQNDCDFENGDVFAATGKIETPAVRDIQTRMLTSFRLLK